ncbi:MAG TPA: general secretion pathway protein GspB [Steroidobacteraceae bacterium]|nr:general secretion pathway protein GspB [Steroidobacteraceae bacterium]
MSFILDALKKSESDRQRQSGPSLFEVKVAPPRRRLPVWAVAIAVLLAINLIVICWMLLRHPSAPAPMAAGESSPSAAAALVARAAPVAAPAAAAASAPAGSEAAPVSAPGGSAAQSGGRQDTAVLQGRSPAGPAPAAAAPATGPTDRATAPSSGNNPSDYAPAVEPATGRSSAATAGAGSTDGLAIYQQIVNSANLPELHLDLHVYADRPQDRFAMINMHRVAEGDSLPSGVQVDAIRPDGVVLSYHGTRFLLPRN